MRAFGLALLALVALGAVGCGSSKPAAADCSGSNEGLATDATEAVPCWTDAEQLPPAAVRGAKLFATSGCTSCHTYVGVGSRKIGAPDLSAIGNRLTVARLERLLADPPQPMPSASALGSARLHQLAVFLAASKGAR